MKLTTSTAAFQNLSSSIATLSHSQTRRNNSGGMIYDIHNWPVAQQLLHQQLRNFLHSLLLMMMITSKKSWENYLKKFTLHKFNHFCPPFSQVCYYCTSFCLKQNCKNVTYFANNPGIICTSADTTKYQSGIMAWIISRILDSYSLKLFFTILETLPSYFKSLGRHDQQNIKEARQGGEQRLLKIAKSNLPPFSGLLWPFLYVSHGIFSGTFFVSFCFYFQPFFLCLTNIHQAKKWENILLEF